MDIIWTLFIGWHAIVTLTTRAALTSSLLQSHTSLPLGSPLVWKNESSIPEQLTASEKGESGSSARLQTWWLQEEWGLKGGVTFSPFTIYIWVGSPKLLLRTVPGSGTERKLGKKLAKISIGRPIFNGPLKSGCRLRRNKPASLPDDLSCCQASSDSPTGLIWNLCRQLALELKYFSCQQDQIGWWSQLLFNSFINERGARNLGPIPAAQSTVCLATTNPSTHLHWWWQWARTSLVLCLLRFYGACPHILFDDDDLVIFQSLYREREE